MTKRLKLRVIYGTRAKKTELRLEDLEAKGVKVLYFDFLGSVAPEDLLKALIQTDENKLEKFDQLKEIEKIVKALFNISQDARSKAEFAALFHTQVAMPYQASLQNPVKLLSVVRSFIALMNRNITTLNLETSSKQQKLVRVLIRDRLITVLEILLLWTKRDMPTHAKVFHQIVFSLYQNYIEAIEETYQMVLTEDLSGDNPGYEFHLSNVKSLITDMTKLEGLIADLLNSAFSSAKNELLELFGWSLFPMKLDAICKKMYQFNLFYQHDQKTMCNRLLEEAKRGYAFIEENLNFLISKTGGSLEKAQTDLATCAAEIEVAQRMLEQDSSEINLALYFYKTLKDLDFSKKDLKQRTLKGDLLALATAFEQATTIEEEKRLFDDIIACANWIYQNNKIDQIAHVYETLEKFKSRLQRMESTVIYAKLCQSKIPFFKDQFEKLEDSLAASQSLLDEEQAGSLREARLKEKRHTKHLKQKEKDRAKTPPTLSIPTPVKEVKTAPLPSTSDVKKEKQKRKKPQQGRVTLPHALKPTTKLYDIELDMMVEVTEKILSLKISEKVEVPDYVVQVMTAIEEAGFKVRIYGGFIRDSLCKKPYHDIDLMTDCPKEILKKILPQSNDIFAVPNLVCIKPSQSDQKLIDISVDLNFNLLESAKKRFLMINALYSTKEGTIEDPLNILDKCLEDTLFEQIDPLTAFRNDPSQIFRSIRSANHTEKKLSEKTEETLCLPECVQLLADMNFGIFQKELETLFKRGQNEKNYESLRKYRLLNLFDIDSASKNIQAYIQMKIKSVSLFKECIALFLFPKIEAGQNPELVVKAFYQRFVDKGDLSAAGALSYIKGTTSVLIGFWQQFLQFQHHLSYSQFVPPNYFEGGVETFAPQQIFTPGFNYFSRTAVATAAVATDSTPKIQS